MTAPGARGAPGAHRPRSAEDAQRALVALERALVALERALLRDPGGRQVAAFALADQLAPAARSLLDARQVVILTGFAVLRAEGTASQAPPPPGPVQPLPPHTAAPETDGPPGAAALARALVGLGRPARLLTDSFCAGALEPLALDVPLDVVDLDPGPQAAQAARDYLQRVGASHVVAIERPGRARDGRYMSMRGVPLGAPVSALDELLLVAGELDPPVVTIAVGDGGNEAGLAAAGEAVARAVRHGAEIATVVPAAWAIVAGTSTWGAYGLVAALSALSGRDLLPSAAEVARDVAALVAAGAVDGVTGRAEPTIDGLPLEATYELLDALRATVRSPTA